MEGKQAFPSHCFVWPNPCVDELAGMAAVHTDILLLFDMVHFLNPFFNTSNRVRTEVHRIAWIVFGIHSPSYILIFCAQVRFPFLMVMMGLHDFFLYDVFTIFSLLDLDIAA
ncbi:MAG: hypothetical protein IPP34_09045 [Bacteroidetes bacterium]|nr:hypothetical protein [Bacteroidota bacterium]